MHSEFTHGAIDAKMSELRIVKPSDKFCVIGWYGVFSVVWVSLSHYGESFSFLWYVCGVFADA